VGGDFKVQISNESPLQTYTWTTPQGAASGEELEITNAQLSDEGDYSVIVEQSGCLSITPGLANIELKKTPAPELLLEGGIVSDAIAPVIVCIEALPKDLQVSNLFESEATVWDYEGQIIDKGQIFESGLYTLTADNGTCTGTAAVEIEVRALEAIINSIAPFAVDQGSEVTFSGDVEPYNPDYTYEYTWKGNIHNTIGKGAVLDFVPNETDDYWVTVDELETGCQAESEEKNVIVYLPVTIPAAFTPNGDGKNELWVIEGLETYEKASVKVFNRWGHIVYKSTGNNYNGWDGLNLSGKDVTTGTYYYIIRLNDVLGRAYQGDVTVIR
jgi:gliding motility-associated-like protein